SSPPSAEVAEPLCSASSRPGSGPVPNPSPAASACGSNDGSSLSVTSSTVDTDAEAGAASAGLSSFVSCGMCQSELEKSDSAPASAPGVIESDFDTYRDTLTEPTKPSMASTMSTG